MQAAGVARAVFLDRDGVINRSIVRDGLPYPPGNVEEFILYEDVAAGCARLQGAGFLLVVATNQPDVGRGTQSREQVEAMHAVLLAAVPGIARVEVCYHAGRGTACDCRKPAPGMLLRAADALGIDLGASFMVGDRWRDVDCGHAAGCTTLLLDRGYAEALRQPPDYTVETFAQAVEVILDAAAHPPPRATRPFRANPGRNLLSPPRREGYVSRTVSTERLLAIPIKIFADGADRAGMLDLYRKPFIQGLTTNPTLMRKVGLTDYEAFAKALLADIRDKPISFEVFSDEFDDMRRQALKIRDWQENVYVKIPITNTRAESALPLIKELAAEGVKLNVTALLTLPQVEGVVEALNPEAPSVISVFAGRVADTGVDPVPLMRRCREITRANPTAELLWASVREVLNIFQAAEAGCQIVTVPHDILAKALKMAGADLAELSLDTVKMFYADATAAGFKL